jgi:hypothetical protein
LPSIEYDLGINGVSVCSRVTIRNAGVDSETVGGLAAYTIEF